MSKVPKSIRIAGHDVVVELVEHGESFERNQHGRWSSALMKMTIDAGLSPPSRVVDVLLHEILHAIWWAYVIHDRDKEERIAAMLSTALTQVLRDNPQLLAFIADSFGCCGSVQGDEK